MCRQKRVAGLVGSLLLMLQGQAQDSARVSLSFHGEVYYGYDFPRPSAHTRAHFIYSHNRTGEVNVNLGLAHAAYTATRMRANLGLMAGTYSNANLAAEEGALKNIYEANAGVRVSKRHHLWIDAGILPSHIGFESAIGKNCRTLTRSLAADNSPYFETGVRLSFSSVNRNWYAALLWLNGWQRIQRVEGNSTPAFGTQLTFTPSEKVSINSSTFVGNDKPDSIRRMRYFHNLHSILQLSRTWEVTLGFDAGAEQRQKGSSAMHFWYTPVVVLRCQLTPKKFLALRAEQYKDEHGVIAGGINGAPFRVVGCSVNFDWNISHALLWRIETRWMQGRHPVFPEHNGTFSRSNLSATTALCFSFQPEPTR